MHHRLPVPQLAWLLGFLCFSLAGCTVDGNSSSRTSTVSLASASDAASAGGSALQVDEPLIFTEADFDALARQAVDRDAFPVLDQPDLVSAEAADEELGADDPVIGVSFGGEAQAYPISVMGGHELINAVCGDVPIAVSW